MRIRHLYVVAAVLVGLIGALLGLHVLTAAPPIPISTTVSIYEPREIDLAGLPQAVLVVACGNAGELTRVQSAATSIWESIAQEGIGTGMFMQRLDSNVPLQFEIDGGSGEGVVAGNLDRLKSAVGGAWERIGDDYLFCLDASGRSDVVDAVSSGGPMPALVVCSPDLARTCAFLRNAFGIRVDLRAESTLATVRQPDDDSYGAYDPEGEQLHFRSDEPLPVNEMVKRLAWFHGASLIETADGYEVVDSSQEDIRRRVELMLTDPDGLSWLPRCSLPRDASRHLKEFLASTDSGHVSSALHLLEHLDASLVVPQLLALAELEHALSDYIPPSKAVLLAGCVRTKEGSQVQQRLMERFAKPPVVTPGTMTVEGMPEGVSVEDAHTIETLALAYMHAFHRPKTGEPDARGFVVFTHDGQRADYGLDVGRHTPPWTCGYTTNVSLERTDGLWFIVGGVHSGHWDGFDGP